MLLAYVWRGDHTQKTARLMMLADLWHGDHNQKTARLMMLRVDMWHGDHTLSAGRLGDHPQCAPLVQLVHGLHDGCPQP